MDTVVVRILIIFPKGITKSPVNVIRNPSLKGESLWDRSKVL